MLQNAEEGSFFVRDSQSRPGCFALTMRVPQEINPSGFGNYLIVKVKGGVMIQASPGMYHYRSCASLSKEFPVNCGLVILCWWCDAGLFLEMLLSRRFG